MKKSFNVLAGIIGLCAIPASVIAAPMHADQQVSSVAITSDSKPGKTILGQDFKYPTGAPLIKGRIVEIKPGQDIEWHKHAIPVYAYVISGNLVVDYGSKGKRTFGAGESYIEAINWCHQAVSGGKEPVKLHVVYLGQQQPDQIKPETCKGSQ